MWRMGQVKRLLEAAMVTHNCPECQQAAKCEIMQGKSTCWCFNVQAKALEMNDICLCKKCLTTRK